VYNDLVGDQAGSAADIQSIAVSDTGGVVTFTIHAPGFVLGPADGAAAIGVLLDTDQNGATGDPFDGADYGFVTRITPDGPSHVFQKWDQAAGWVEIASPTMTYSEDAQAGSYTFTLSSGDLGGASLFDFYAVSTTAQSDSYDIAPNGDEWFTYEITSTAPPGAVEPTPPASVEPTPAAPAAEPRPIMELPNGSRYLLADREYHQISPAQFSAFELSVQAINHVGELYEAVGAPATNGQVAALKADYVNALKEMGVDMTAATIESKPAVTSEPPAVPEKPVISKPVAVPAKATAGKVFSVSFPVTSSVTGAKLVSATMIGNPSVKGTVIKHHEQFKNGNATIRLTIPATARGKTLKVNLKMVLGEQSAIRIATFLVR
jgi:hypothetical protein